MRRRYLLFLNGMIHNWQHYRRARPVYLTRKEWWVDPLLVWVETFTLPLRGRCRQCGLKRPAHKFDCSEQYK